MKKFLLVWAAFLIANAISFGQISPIMVSSSNGLNGNYTSLTNAGGVFAAFNGGADQTGFSPVITILADVPAEAGTNGLNAGNWTLLKIVPSGIRTISGTVAGAPLILFNGADNVTFDGLNTSGNSLTISNLSSSSSAGTSTIKFLSDASNNTITNCSVLGSATVTLSTTGGNIFISTGTTTGNDNITISNCKIGPAGTNLPSKLVSGNGSTTNATIANNNVTVTNCELFDYFLSGGCAAVYAQTGCSDWSITNNKIYQTTSRTFTSAGTMYGIYFSNPTYGNNIQITGNTIGYANNAGTGTLTLLGSTIAGNFLGIYHNHMITAALASNINNNTISDISLTSSTGAFYGIYNTTTGASSNTININNNAIKNVILVTTTGTFYAISWGTASNINITGNSIYGITRNAAGAVYGIYSAGSSVNETISNNTIYNVSVTTATSASNIYGIYQLTATGTKLFENNVVHDLSGISGSSIFGIYVNFGTTDNIDNNQVYSLASIGGSSGAVVGICSGSNATTMNIFKNYICGLSSTSIGPVVSGIIIGSGTTRNVYNNLIGNLTAPAANSAEAIRGINISSIIATSNINVYYNTVYINASSTGANFGTTGIFHTASTTSTTTTLDLRDNIIVNKSTAAGTGLTVAFRRSAGTTGMLANYASTSNNNLFYAGVPSATNVIYYDGTSTAQTMANYKAGVFTAGTITPRDSASFSEDAHFLNTVCGNASFLKINATIATQIESGGKPVTGITDDYAGTLRNVTTPDVGAYEGNYLGIDLNPPAIVYTPLSNTTSLATRILPVTITDYSGVGSGANQPVLYWKKTGDVGYTGPLAPVSIVGNVYTYTFGAGVIVGNVVSYFIVAQDNATGNNVCSYPAGATVTTNPPLASAGPASPSTYLILGSICGNKTIGVSVSCDYATLTAAIADLNSKQLCGPLTYTLMDASYSTSETFPLVINPNPGSSAVNVITFVPGTGVNATVTGALASGALLKVLTSYVVIDGSNNGTTSRNLTITNTSATTPQVMVIGSTGTAPITNVTLKNSIIINGVNSSSAIIVSDGAAPGTAGYFNNITFQNNSISKAYMGVYNNAVVATGNGSGLLFLNNEFTGSAANAISGTSIYVQGVDTVTVTGNTISNGTHGTYSINPVGVWFATGTRNGTISGNTISNLSYTGTGAYAPVGILVTSAVTAANVRVTGNTVSGLTSSGTGWTSGIYVGGGVLLEGVTVLKNKITNIKNTNSGGYSANGIALWSTSNTSNTLVANNFISDVAGYGYASSTTDNGFGIRIEGGGGFNVYYNSVNMNTNQTSATGLPAALIINSPVSAANCLDIQNNIFAITATAGTNRYAVECSAANTVFGAMNYNDYYSTGPYLGYIGAVNRVDLAAWQAGTGKDALSVAGDPKYQTATDLHIQNNAITVVSNAGGYLSVTDDIDGDARAVSTGKPDIGADEYTPAPLPPSFPTGVTAVATSATHIDVIFIVNAYGNNVAIAWNNTGTFTAPSGPPGAPGSAFAGGTLLSYGTTSPVGQTCTPQTHYYYMLYSYDLTNYSTGVAVDATTPCGPFTGPFPFQESFDGTTFVPNCWALTQVSGTGNWARSTSGSYPTTSPHSGAGMAFFNSFSFSAGVTSQMITPAITMPAGLYRVKFWMVRDVGYSTYVDLVNVYCNATPNTAGATLLGTIHRYKGLSPVETGADGWYQYSMTVPTTSGSTQYFIFEAVSQYGNNMFIDDINIDAMETCPAPTALTTTPGNFFANLGWTPGGVESSWQVEWGPSTFTHLVDGTIVTVYTGTPAPPYLLSGLTPLTAYKFYVRANCGSGLYSTWTGPYSFTTLVACQDPSTLAAVPSITSATLSWNPNGTSAWDIEWKAGATFVQGTGTTVTGVTNPYVLGGLSSSTTYSYYVRANCGVYLSNWVGPFAFTTLCAVASLPLCQTFDAATLPNCWSYQMAGAFTSNHWSMANSVNAGGAAYEARAYYSPSQGAVELDQNRMVSPAFDITGVTNVNVSFKHMFDNYSTGAADVWIKVQYSFDGTNFTDAWSYAGGSANPGIAAETKSLNITITGIHTTMWIAWTLAGNSYDINNWYVDNVCITHERNHDMATTSVDMISYYGPGSVITPKATIRNNGSSDEISVPITMFIGQYLSSVVVPSVLSGQSVQVSFAPWTPSAGSYTATACTGLTPDEVPANDCMSKSVGIELVTKFYGYNASTSQAGYFYKEHPEVWVNLAAGTTPEFYSAGAWANGIWYASEYYDNTVPAGGGWFTIDPATGAQTKIAQINIGFNGLAYDHSTNTMYGIVYDDVAATNDLYTIIPATGAATLIGTVLPGTELLVNLATDGSGSLYGIGVIDDLTVAHLFKIYPTVGSPAIADMGSTGYILYYAQDMGYDYSGSTMYAAAYLYSGGGGLYTVNLGTGAMTSVGAFLGAAEIDGLGIPYTTCSTALPVCQSFPTSSLPACWSYQQTDNIGNCWSIVNSSNAGGAPFEAIATGANSNFQTAQSRMVAPPFSLSGIGAVQVNFKQEMVGYTNGGYNVALKVQYSYNGTTFTDAWSHICGDSIGIPAETKSVIINVQPGHPQMWIAWTLAGRTTGIENWYVDDICISSICSPPTSVLVANDSLTTTSAHVSWTVSAVTPNPAWLFEYGPTGFALGSGIGGQHSVSNPYITLNSLSHGTEYDFYVSTFCGAGDSSTWVKKTFRTHYFDCPAGSTAEGEACGSDINGGCYMLSPAFTPITCGETICGTSWFDGSNRDTDWYLFTLSEPANVTWSGKAEFPCLMGIIASPCPDTAFIASATGAAGTTVSVSTYLTAGTYSAFAAPQFSEIVKCDSLDKYYTTLTCINPCPDPSALTATNITAATALLDWTNGGTESSWSIKYGHPGFNPSDSGTFIYGIGAHPYLLNPPLAPNKSYDFYVRANCSGDTLSGWSGPRSFTTLCAAVSLPVCETFPSDSLPDCWSYQITGAITYTRWSLVYSANAGGTPFEALAAGGGGISETDQSRMVSSPINITDVSAVQVNFKQAMVGNPNGSNSAWLKVQYSYDGTTFSDAWSYNCVGPDGIPAETKSIIINLQPGHPKMWIAWTLAGNTSGIEYWAVDDISILLPCLEPTSLTADPCAYAAEIGWAGSASTFDIQYGPHGFVPPENSTLILDIGANNFYINGLNPSTQYDYYVRAECDCGTVGAWSDPMTFKTLSTLPVCESFAGSGLPDGWSTQVDGSITTNHWSISNSANAGGAAYEAVALSTPQEGTLETDQNRLVSPPICISGMNIIQVNFRQRLNVHFSMENTDAWIKVQYSFDGVNFVDAWSHGGRIGLSIPASPDSVIITNFWNHSKIWIAWTLAGHTEYIYDWSVDDICVINSPYADVGPTAIGVGAIIPPGLTVHPTADIHNFGMPSGGHVTMTIGSGYTSTKYLPTYFLPDSTITIDFDAWTPPSAKSPSLAPESYTVQVCTYLYGDANPSNDCMSQGVVVKDSTKIYAYVNNGSTSTLNPGPVCFYDTRPSHIIPIGQSSPPHTMSAGAWVNGVWVNSEYYNPDNATGGGWWTIDTLTGAMTQVGNSLGRSFNGLAYDRTRNVLYGIDYDAIQNINKLYTIIPASGLATPLGSLVPNDFLLNLSCSDDGFLYSIGTVSDHLFRINPAGPSGPVVYDKGYCGNDFYGFQGIGYDYKAGVMYLASVFDPTNAGLMTVNLSTGKTTLIGRFPGNAQLNSVAIPYSANKTLHLSSVLLEGLYNGSSTMIEAKDVTYDEDGNITGVISKWGDNVADHITVELHASTTHYDDDCDCQVSDYPTVIYPAPDVPLSITGSATVTIPSVKNGLYYLTIKQRNHIETVSALPVNFSGATISYAFDALSQALDGNLTTVLEADGETVSPPLIFGGDVNQDGQVEAEDMNEVGNDASTFVYGYVPTDVYADGQVESGDINVTGNNAANFVYTHRPM